MKQEEIIGWLGMITGLIITSLPFVVSYITNNLVNDNLFSVSLAVIGVITFLIGSVKAIPGIIDSLLAKPSKNSYSKQPTLGDVDHE